MQESCLCDVHHRCALGLCGDTILRARFVGGARQITCPNPALHEVHEEVDLHPLLQQNRTLGRSTNMPDEHAIGNRVTAAELRLRSRTHIAPERVYLPRSTTERGEADLQGEWRGTMPQPQADAPCGVCLKHMGGRPEVRFPRFLIVHRRCAVESAERPVSRGDGRFRVAIRGRTGPPRRRTFFSRKQCCGFMCGTTAPPIGAPINNASWRCFGDH